MSGSDKRDGSLPEIQDWGLSWLLARRRAPGREACEPLDIAPPKAGRAACPIPVDFLGISALLNARHVHYVLVGGLAVVLHGIDRITADIDLALDLSAESVSKTVSALQGAGLRPMLPIDAQRLADPSIRR